MRGPKPETLNLSEAEQNELKALVHRHTTPQQQALRGRVILAAADGKTNSQIARELKVCVDTVRAWRGAGWNCKRSRSLICPSVSASLICLGPEHPLG